MENSINRRAAFAGIGAFVSTAALAVPAAAAVQAAECPRDKVRRLQRELGVALAELAAAPGGFDYVSVVEPAGTKPYNRSLIDRDVYLDDRRREDVRSQAIGRWRYALDHNEDWPAALNDMLVTFRTI